MRLLKFRLTDEFQLHKKLFLIKGYKYYALLKRLLYLYYKEKKQMVRSMYSGVAGMKIEQTRMDVIGNNIANVSTAGYKGGRATFRDVFYQTNSAASAPSGMIGGVNAKEVGVGAKSASIDINHSQAVMTTTGFGLDVAITGEGYLQVQDRSGNIFYTKAGMLDIDADGNLVDSNGNFVLGVSGNPATQGPGSDRIQIQLPNLPASIATASETINQKDITISSTNRTELANVVIKFETTNNLPLNSRAKASVNSDAILVQLNDKETFLSTAGDPEAEPPIAPTTWLDDFNDVVNQAIKEAYGGNAPLGEIKIEIDDPTAMSRTSYSAEDIISSEYSYSQGGFGVLAPVLNPNWDGEDESSQYLDEDGQPTDIDSARRTLSFDKDTKIPGAWGELGFQIEHTGSEFGAQWSSGLENETLNRKVSDVVMSVAMFDKNSDQIYDSADDSITFNYFVADSSGPATTYATGSDPDTGVPINRTGNGWLYTATLPRSSMTEGGSVILKISDPTGAVQPTEADSITINFPSLSKMQSAVTEGGVTDWGKYFIDTATGETGWDVNKDGVFGDTDGDSFPNGTGFAAVASDISRSLGLGSKNFALSGGTEGGAQTAADLTSIGIDDKGVISGLHAAMGRIEFGRIDLATFSNPAGLTQQGDTYFAESLNSGEAKVVMPGSNGTGSIASGTLETSNVDLSSEFSDMILTQRSFQANSRIITVSDSMIEELINLKR
jgi:flagellar hook-basal body protein